MSLCCSIDELFISSMYVITKLPAFLRIL